MRTVLALLSIFVGTALFSADASLAQVPSSQDSAYTSPQFDYEVSWLPPWQFSESSSKEGDFDWLRLAAGDSYYEYLGLAREFDGGSTDTEFDAASNDILHDVADERRRLHPQLTVEQESNIGGSHSFPMILQYANEDGEMVQEYLRLSPLSEQKAVLVTVFSTPATSSADLRAELIARISGNRSSWQVQPAEGASLQSLLGSVRLRASFETSVDGTCAGIGTFMNVGAGTRVVVANVANVGLVEGFLGLGLPVERTTGRGMDCVFLFAIWNMPLQPFYRFYVGDFAPHTVDQSTLERADWTIEFEY